MLVNPDARAMKPPVAAVAVEHEATAAYGETAGAAHYLASFLRSC